MMTRYLVMAVVLLASVQPARAGGEYFVNPGIVFGRAHHDDAESSTILGAEISAGIFDARYAGQGEPGHSGSGYDLGMLWYGAFADVVHDTSTGTTRIGLGPELGAFCLGIDASVVTELGGDDQRWGVAVRPVLTVGWVALYGRGIRWLDDGPTSTVSEVGILVKYVLPWSRAR